jgi:bifunctional DNA-binding transcriptional regulator/antitoxin component of YhaV-PrlF toxin-antitoxin module
VIKIKEKIISITKKDQATLPKEMRVKYGINKKAVAQETSEGILIKPIQTVEEKMGSLKELFKEKTSKELLVESRKMDEVREKKLEAQTLDTFSTPRLYLDSTSGKKVPKR